MATQTPTVIQSLTLNELRGILSDEIQRLRTNETSPANVNAISNASGKILSTIKLELEVTKLLGRQPKGVAGLLGSEDGSVKPE